LKCRSHGWRGSLITVAQRPVPQAGDESRVTAVFFVVKPKRLELDQLAGLAGAGKLRPQVAEVYPPEEARAACERLANERARGKIVIKVAD
jgi:NADPH:quinone reductase-like Zn-dependent oxidoreductase